MERESQGEAVVVVDGRGAGRQVIDLEDSPVLPAGAGGASDHIAAENRLRTPRGDFIAGEEQREGVSQIHICPAFNVRQVAVRGEWPLSLIHI